MWLFRLSAILYTLFGLQYFQFRFGSIDDNTWHSCVLLAEIALFIGSAFRLTSYWGYRDTKAQAPVHLRSETTSNPKHKEPITIALFIPTHNESEELLSQTLEDVAKLYYPFEDVTITSYLLDDGQRPSLKNLCNKYGVIYFGKPDNRGYKAGNLNYAFARTHEDLIAILDADTRPFTNFLGHITGYFKDPKVAWVQTPQWYYDLSSPMLPSEYGNILLGKFGRMLGKVVDNLTFKKLYVNKDIYASNPKFFYDAILRNRNPYNGVFSCGAGSIYRRSALEQFAEKKGKTKAPFTEHISEDIFTSMEMHAMSNIKSVYHHYPECKMLSPQDTTSWVKQQTRYASGAIDMGLRSFPLFKKGLTLTQRLLYFSVFYNYFTPLLAYIFFLTPILFFGFNITSLPEIDFSYLQKFIPYQLLNLGTFIIANWGISTKRPDQKFWNSFYYVSKSWLAVLTRQKLVFNVTPKSCVPPSGLKHVMPHIITILLLILTTVLHIVQGHSVVSLEQKFYLFWVLYFLFQLNQFIRMWIWDGVRKNMP